MKSRHQREQKERLIAIVVMVFCSLVLLVMIIFAKADLVIIHSDTLAEYLSLEGQVERLERDLYGEVNEELECIEKGDC